MIIPIWFFSKIRFLRLISDIAKDETSDAPISLRSVCGELFLGVETVPALIVFVKYLYFLR